MTTAKCVQQYVPDIIIKGCVARSAVLLLNWFHFELHTGFFVLFFFQPSVMKSGNKLPTEMQNRIRRDWLSVPLEQLSCDRIAQGGEQDHLLICLHISGASSVIRVDLDMTV